MARFQLISGGNIVSRQPTDPTPLALCPRCVVLGDGQIVCSFMTQTKLGINDFVPMIARSRDGGATWSEQGAVWPQLARSWSMFVSLSAKASSRDELFLVGSRTRIDAPGETFWSDATTGLKQNELIWSSSRDAGRTWSAPTPIAMPILGAAEAPGPMVVTRGNRWIAPYSPYNTFDPNLKVDRGQVVTVYSDDRGATWRHSAMLRFAEPNSGGAEAWVCELSDGGLLGSAWHVNHTPADKPGEAAREYPNKYAISRDGGATWGPTRSTEIMGHTTALTALADGSAILTTVRRRKDADSGIWLTVVRPGADDSLGIESDECVWSATRATQRPGDADVSHDNWVSYSFGEPSLTPLPDGSLLLAFWYAESGSAGLRYLKLSQR